MKDSRLRQISQLRLRNWRNFQTVDVALRDRTFIVGPNASGKSNLLDAIRFLRDLVRDGGGLQAAIAQRGGLSKIRCLAARAQPDVEIEVEIDGGREHFWRYALGIRTPKGKKGEPELTHERVWRGGEKLLERPTDDDRDDPRRLTQTHLEQINANLEFRAVADFLAAISYRHLVPQVVRSPGISVTQPFEQEAFGSRFVESVLQTAKRTRDARLKRIENALKQAVPQLRGLKVIRDEKDGTSHLEAVYEHWRPHGARQREDQFSDGTLRMIALFWSLLDGESPLLLEEPELSLHQEIVDQLPSLIHKVRSGSSSGRGRQVLITTHNFKMLEDRGVAPEEVLILEPSPEGTAVRLAAEEKTIEALVSAGIPVGEAVAPLSRPATLEQLSHAFR